MHGVCNWCRKDNGLQDFSTHDGIRTIFIAGLCSARCFELAVRRVRDNEDFNVVGHFDEIKISAQETSNFRIPLINPETSKADEKTDNAKSPINSE